MDPAEEVIPLSFLSSSVLVSEPQKHTPVQSKH
jgi:hypothetical protein